MSKVIVIVGNIVDGFQFYGPFTDNDAAVEWADANVRLSEWVTAELQDVEVRHDTQTEGSR